MRPVKHTELIPEIANRCQISPEQAELVLVGYFSEVRKALSSLAFPRVQVLNLGTFFTKSKELNQRLEHKKALVKKYPESTGRLANIVAEAAREVAEITACQDIVADEKDRKKQVKLNRILTYESNRCIQDLAKT